MHVSVAHLVGDLRAVLLSVLVLIYAPYLMHAGVCLHLQKKRRERKVGLKS